MNELNTIINRINSINKDVICVALDGYCGSGKTTFANKLQAELNCNLVHIDDFYLPFSERKENWKEILAGNMNFTRLKNEVLTNLNEASLSYGIFNPRKQQIVSYSEMTKKRVFILEGAYSHHPDIRKFFDYFIFFKCEDEKQNERLMAREGDHYEAFKSVWIKRERDYFAGYSIIDKADIIIDTTNWF